MNNSNSINITYDSAKSEVLNYISTKNINIKNNSLIKLWRKIRVDLPAFLPIKQGRSLFSNTIRRTEDL
jgi:hypothetical protein